MESDPSHEDHDRLLDRIEDLERTVRARDEEIGQLKLQLDLLSTIDPATGLLSKRGVVDAIEVALLRFDRQEEPFGVMVFREPHLGDMLTGDDSAGDALRHFAALFSAGLRELDRKARLDTDTFAAIMPAVTPVDMPPIISRLRSLITAGPVVIGDRRLEPDPLFAALVVASKTERDAKAVLDLALSWLSNAEVGKAAVGSI